MIGYSLKYQRDIRHPKYILCNTIHIAKRDPNTPKFITEIDIQTQHYLFVEISTEKILQSLGNYSQIDTSHIFRNQFSNTLFRILNTSINILGKFNRHNYIEVMETVQDA